MKNMTTISVDEVTSRSIERLKNELHLNAKSDVVRTLITLFVDIDLDTASCLYEACDQKTEVFKTLLSRAHKTSSALEEVVSQKYNALIDIMHYLEIIHPTLVDKYGSFELIPMRDGRVAKINHDYLVVNRDKAEKSSEVNIIELLNYSEESVKPLACFSKFKAEQLSRDELWDYVSQCSEGQRVYQSVLNDGAIVCLSSELSNYSFSQLESNVFLVAHSLDVLETNKATSLSNDACIYLND